VRLWEPLFGHPPERNNTTGAPAASNEPWANAGVIDELKMLATTPQGGLPPGANPHRRPGRNNWLNDSGLRTARLLPNYREWLRGQLIDACHSNGLVTEDGIRTVEGTINSAFSKADQAGPAPIPEPRIYDEVSGLNTEATPSDKPDDGKKNDAGSRRPVAHPLGPAGAARPRAADR
jgi:hypothetical protein